MQAHNFTKLPLRRLPPRVVCLVVLVFTACLSSSCTTPRTVLECSADFICPSGLYCELGKDCGGIDRKGICMYQPPDCRHEEDIVCGCNGREYPGKCYANGAGVTVAYPGRCMRSVPK